MRRDKHHIDSASVQCQKCGRELRENFLVTEGGSSALTLLLEYAAKIHRWTVASDMILCNLCASGKGPTSD